MKCVQRLFAKSAIATVLAVGLSQSATASACSTEPYIGSICYMVTSYCPEGYLPANGQTVTINQYQALYALIGNIWGGSLQQGNFALPDMRGRVPVGVGQGPGLANVTRAQVFGAENVSLTTSNVAPHIHPATITASGNVSGTASIAIPVVNGAATTNVPDNTTSLATTSPSFDLSALGGADSPAKIYSNAAPTTTLKPFSAPFSATSLTGITISPNIGGTPFSVRNPSVGLTACIAAIGIFPVNPN
ncbi:phage tail protein [Pectobacterium brasiliense]|uniref:phage tail protein n=1 Tax=Pectobacterium brasiliense TaxID=180957 RepID=UPI0025A23576|nr:tail fiber protein [Pectobacterium brasiliense]WJM79243.1 tail fiber protein [Pectobacterium brasiliense]